MLFVTINMSKKAILLEDEWRLRFLNDRFPKVEYTSTSEKI